MGSNSLRLMIASGSGTGLPLRQELAETRLGKGLLPGGRLHPDSRARTLDALDHFLEVARHERAGRGIIAATGAVRDAADGRDFLKLVQERSPFPVRLLSEEEEARCSFEGSVYALDIPPQQEEGPAVLDLGGRSSELSWKRKGSFYFQSIPWGAVNLHEAFLEYTAGEKERRALETFCRQEISRGLPPGTGETATCLIGLGGTITTLAAAAQNLKSYSPGRVHRFLLQRRVIARLNDRLQPLSPAERASFIPFAPRRSDIILAGGILLQTFMDHLGVDALTVSEEGLLWGLIKLFS